MIGRTFGLLTVKSVSERSTSKRLIYVCDCKCGTKDVEVSGDKLRSGWTKSCGCLVKKRASEIHKKINTYDITGPYGIGICSNSDTKFFFDLEDYEKIKDYCWMELKNGYIATSLNDGRFIYLHRLVMNATSGQIVDHVQHNLYDCRKEELRIGTQSNNMMNLSMRIDNTSGTTGVWLDKRNNNWVAEIKVNKEKINLGSFVNKNDAIKARRNAEEKYFKNWSYKNSTGLYNNENLEVTTKCPYCNYIPDCDE